MTHYVTGVKSVAADPEQSILNLSWESYVKAQGRIASYLRSNSSDEQGGLTSLQQTHQDVHRISLMVAQEKKPLMMTNKLKGYPNQTVLLEYCHKHYGVLSDDVKEQNDYQTLVSALRSSCSTVLFDYLTTHLNQSALLQLSAPIRYFRCEFLGSHQVEQMLGYQISPLFILELHEGGKATLDCLWFSQKESDSHCFARSRLLLQVKGDKVQCQQSDFQWQSPCLACYQNQFIQQKTMQRMSFSDEPDQHNKFGPNIVAIADAVNQLFQHASLLQQSKPLKAKALMEVAKVASDYLSCRLNQQSTSSIKATLMSTLIKHRQVLTCHSNILLRLVRGACNQFSKFRLMVLRKPRLSHSGEFYRHALSTRSEQLAARVVGRTAPSARFTLSLK